MKGLHCYHQIYWIRPEAHKTIVKFAWFETKRISPVVHMISRHLPRKKYRTLIMRYTSVFPFIWYTLTKMWQCLAEIPRETRNFYSIQVEKFLMTAIPLKLDYILKQIEQSPPSIKTCTAVKKNWTCSCSILCKERDAKWKTCYYYSFQLSKKITASK